MASIRYTLFFLWALCSIASKAHNHQTFVPNESLRSDTINVLNYEVELEWTGSVLKGNCKVRFKSKMNGVNSIVLDLLKLKVDSVWNNQGKPMAFTHSNDSLLKISMPVLNSGDTSSVRVFYSGIPFHEQWGGWHNQGGYVFNLGVGFKSIPHNLGKAWHPCFDNFVERASYLVSITCDTSLFGVGSGVQVSHTTSLGKRTTTWELKQDIPSYLYGIAISNYAVIRDSIVGLSGVIPVELYCKPSQTNAAQSAFTNLDSMFLTYEKYFGPYRWDKVGYSITAIGAMEHATNISYPAHALSAETTIAHELSHHWWGNLITCETDRDMWINEGMAVFCEYLFLEDQYGEYTMNISKESNLFQVVRYAHLEEGGYQPISGVPRVHTYGKHTYRKGSLVAHNLRRYLGDSVFFKSMTQFLDSFRFKPVNSYDLLSFLNFSTGKNLTPFFEDWVFMGGMPDFQLWAWKSLPTAGLYNNSITLKQNRAGSETLHRNVPLKIRFYGKNGSYWQESIIMSKASQTFQFQSPVEVIQIEVNPNYEMSYAVTKARDTLRGNGNANSSYLNLGLQVSQIIDTTTFWAQTHWTAPYISIENQVELGVRVNPARYWQFSALIEDSLRLNFNTFYDASFGNLDSGLVKYSEDSLVLLYRPINGDWVSLGNSSIQKGTVGDNKGVLIVNRAKPGQYVLAEKDPAINDTLLKEKNVNHSLQSILAYPNPSGNSIALKREMPWTGGEYKLINIKGLEVQNGDIPKMGKEINLNLESLENGVYFYLLHTPEGDFSGRFIKGAYSK